MKKLNISQYRTFGVVKLSVLIVTTIISVGFYQSVFAVDGKQISQRTFSSPEKAMESLMNALSSDNTKELLAILGQGGKKIIFSGDEIADKAGREHFVKAFHEMNRLEIQTDKKVILVVGNNEWPFPIPMVKKGKTWSFDTTAGRNELLNRRIGKNELNTIHTCLAYADAQREFAIKDRDSDKLREYAQTFMSNPGKKDGLYWEARDGEEPSPFGPFVARAVREGYVPNSPQDRPAPYHGYFYKILKAQGKNASGGAYDYVIKDKMIGGFALVAYPAEYGASGIMTFIINHDGIVYQKDLGSNTDKIAGSMMRYDPDKTWKKVEESNIAVQKTKNKK